MQGMVRWIVGVFVVGVAACGSSVDVPPGGSGGAVATSTTTGPGGGGSGGAGTATTVTIGTGGAGICGGTVGDYGDCQLPLGWIYDGGHCVPVSGCGCEPDCDAFSDDASGCVAGCAGTCDTTVFLGAGIASDDWGVGDGCDELHACLEPGSAQLIESVLSEPLTCTDQSWCEAGEQSCRIPITTIITPELYDELCGAALLEGLVSWRCVVYGP